MLVSPFVARAQSRIRKIGWLSSANGEDAESKARVTAFREGLNKLGWIEGRNIQIEYRWAGGDVTRIKAFAAELVRLAPDLIFVAATTSLTVLQQQTRTIPIVFAQVADPVGGGFVASLARPGGNTTGFASYEYTVGVKWLELLKQLAPAVSRVGLVYDPAQPNVTSYYSIIRDAGSTFGTSVTAIPVRTAAEIEREITAFASAPGGGLIVLGSPLTEVEHPRIAALALRHRLPSVNPFRYYPTDGGLASYGIDNIDLYRQAASYVDRILKGEKPGDLPVQAATRFQLVINLKTAAALGLDVPVTLLARTDDVIE